MESKDTPETAEDHHSSNDTPKPSDVSNEDHAIEPSIADVSPNLNLEGIELVLQWFSETAKTVAGGPEALKVVQTVILRQAMKHQFLLHGLLALAALHLAHSHSGNDLIAEAKYINIATAYHDQGLMRYRSILKDINEENYSATVAFSSLTVTYAFAQSRPVKGVKGNLTLLDDLVQILMLGKGWRDVVTVSESLHLMLKNEGSVETDEPDLPVAANVSTAFARVQKFKARDHQNEEELMIYSTAIKSLRTAFGHQVSPAGAANIHLSLAWTSSLQAGFVNVLRERQPLALLMVGYFCVILHKVPELYWWISGWGQGLFGTIWQELEHEPEYQRELEWIRELVLDDGKDPIAEPMEI